MTRWTSRPLVRPRFAKWSLVVFLLVLPFAVHAVWDYAAARQLEATIDAIAARQEPVGLLDVEPYSVLSSEAAEAARYYTAAAALATYSSAQNTRFLNEQLARVEKDVDEGRLTADTTEVLGMIVEDAGDALRLLDHATPLIFEHLGPGTDYSYRWSHFQQLARIAGLRTVLLAREPGDAAAESLYGELRLQRPLARAASLPTVDWVGVPDHVRRLRWVLDRTEPSAAALGKIARELERLDADDVMKRYFLNQRAWIIDLTFGGRLGRSYAGADATRFRSGRSRDSLIWMGVAWRPWAAQQLNRTLDQFDAIIQAADEPWPERIDAIHVSSATDANRPRAVIRPPVRTALSFARNIALARIARVVTAVELYRRDHAGALPETASELTPRYLQSLPVDPFSGEPIKFAVDGSSYKIYSAGTNRKDDGGRFDGTELLGRDAAKKLDAAADFGLIIHSRQ